MGTRKNFVTLDISDWVRFRNKYWYSWSSSLLIFLSIIFSYECWDKVWAPVLSDCLSKFWVCFYCPNWPKLSWDFWEKRSFWEYAMLVSVRDSPVVAPSVFADMCFTFRSLSTYCKRIERSINERKNKIKSTKSFHAYENLPALWKRENSHRPPSGYCCCFPWSRNLEDYYFKYV